MSWLLTFCITIKNAPLSINDTQHVNTSLVPMLSVIFFVVVLNVVMLSVVVLILSNCDICVKQNISVINETKQNEISLKLKVYE
jgi:hypothetical protein